MSGAGQTGMRAWSQRNVDFMSPDRALHATCRGRDEMKSRLMDLWENSAMLVWIHISTCGLYKEQFVSLRQTPNSFRNRIENVKPAENIKNEMKYYTKH